jgi:hypothetical protein
MMPQGGQHRPGSRRARWAVGLGAALGAAAAAAGACGLIYLSQPGSAWLLRALTSPLSITCAAILVFCGALAAAIVTVLWRAGAPHRGRARGEHGEAIIEFALAMPLLLGLALVMAQTSLVMVGNVCVHYSAFCAARAAVVTVPKNLSQNEPRNVVVDDSSSGKMHQIKMAAVWALMPVSCGSEDVSISLGGTLSGGLADFFSLQGAEEPAWVDDRLARKLSYAADLTRVALSPPAQDKPSYQEHENLFVRVEHTFYLAVPYAARLFAAFPGGTELSFGEGEYGTVIAASSVLPNEGVQDYVDVEQFPPDR